MRAALELLLADGARWLIRPRNDEAAKIVARLGEATCLGPAQGRGRRLDVVVDGRSREAGRVPVAGDRDPVRCVLSPPEDEDMLTIQMTYLSLAVARDVQTRGGLLLHGALAERDGNGIILAGPGNVGKSTASRRLPHPWKSLCDDTCLVVRDGQDRYWAHPWPTWSEFYQNVPGGTWDVQQAVPLKAVFFLQQSCKDSVEAINASQAQAMLMESAGQVSRSMTRKCSDREIRAVHAEQMAAATAMASAVPAHMLHVSLTGKFWEEIEKVLSRSRQIRGHGPQPSAVSNHGTTMDVVYTGPSMNPTLWAGDLLTVVPYGRSNPRAGDGIYFRRRGQLGVVHRVLRVHDANVTTRGDNNRDDDPYTVQRHEIIGRVVAARTANGLRKISGGRRGIFSAYMNRIRKPVLITILRFLRWPYRGLAATGVFRRLLPNHFRPIVVHFQVNRFGEEFKLMLAGREVGRYDDKNNDWRIHPPYRLVVDENRLHHPDQGLRKVERIIEPS
ncbi:MAG: SynChlorMet cassette protein ScmC [Planctomycetota bacterium]